MGQNGTDVLLADAGLLQRFPGVGQMFLGELLIVIIVQIADGFPVFPVSVKMIGHSAHSGTDGDGVGNQMGFMHGLCIEFFGFG